MLSIGLLGFIVWSHHMFTVGLDVDTFVSGIKVTLSASIKEGKNYLNNLVSTGLYSGTSVSINPFDIF